MRIVFASIGSFGDLHPMLALAQACRERGHNVVIATLFCYQEKVATFGMEFFPLAPDINLDDVSKFLFSNPGNEDYLQKKILFNTVEKTYADLLKAANGADIIIANEGVYVASSVAEKLAIPWANALLTPIALPASTSITVDAYPEFYFLINRWEKQKLIELTAPFFELRRELGFTKTLHPLFEGRYSPFLVLVLFPSFLESPQPDWKGRVVQTGFPFLKETGDLEIEEKLESFFTSGKAPLLFTLGSTAVHVAKNFYQIAAEVVQTLGERAILLLGNNPQPIAPADQILSLSYAPLSSILPRTRVVIHHGGIGSCAQGLRAGVPALIIPFAFDQPDNAERLHQLGVADILPRDQFSKESLLSHLQSILSNNTMKARAQEISKEIDPRSDMEKSVDAIASLIRKS